MTRLTAHPKTSFKAFAAALVAAAIILVYNGTALAAAPRVTARAAVVMERSSRRVLFEKNARERLPMASTTKIMTALTALMYGRLTDVVTVSETAARMPGSSVYLRAGEKLTLEQLLYGLMLESGNDASVAIAEHVGGSVQGFLELMNREAARIGAADTRFASTCGLDTPGHYTTAYDLALIASEAMGNGDFRRIVSTKAIRIPYEGLENGRSLSNTNRLLYSSFEGANGIKTGYTGKAGKCFVGAAERGGMQLIAVILNCGARFEESSALMADAFTRYEMVRVVEPRQAVGAVGVADGIRGTVRVGSPVELTVPLNAEERGQVCTSVRLDSCLKAPVAPGRPVGEAVVLVGGKPVGSYPVVSLEADGKRTFLWTVKQIARGFLWKGSWEESGFRNTLRPAE